MQLDRIVPHDQSIRHGTVCLLNYPGADFSHLLSHRGETDEHTAGGLTHCIGWQARKRSRNAQRRRTAQRWRHQSAGAGLVQHTLARGRATPPRSIPLQRWCAAALQEMRTKQRLHSNTQISFVRWIQLSHFADFKVLAFPSASKPSAFCSIHRTLVSPIVVKIGFGV